MIFACRFRKFGALGLLGYWTQTVNHNLGDIIGKFLAVCSLMPLAIITGFVTLILFRRDLHTITFFAGALLNEAINLVLKNIIAEPRPLQRGGLYTEYGMPSSHSQMMWFFASYSILFLIFRLHHISSYVMEFLWKVLVAVGLITAAIAVTYSRVYLLYHSWAQVLLGALVGMVLGCGWFGMVHIMLTPLFPTVASWSVCERLMIRDTSLIPNILWFEYTHARTENRARNRKLTSIKSQ
ncbi:dolichyldiphosphatase 1-like isoform X2 [Eriocheir sinensis]|uniref:dolichyldiphosphatase 1-like isoform X2 n=1 Tax=Eriocheir sinensis TaxID=95602 RepID=UPI0021C5F53B|nr:dolichyldiphosphatase 1-like isoform X2 [Eriocheir sinensis]